MMNICINIFFYTYTDRGFARSVYKIAAAHDVMQLRKWSCHFYTDSDKISI